MNNLIWIVSPILIAYFLYKNAPLSSKNISIVFVCSLLLNVSLLINFKLIIEIPYLYRVHNFIASFIAWLFIWNALKSKERWHIFFAWIFIMYDLAIVLYRIFNLKILFFI